MKKIKELFSIFAVVTLLTITAIYSTHIHVQAQTVTNKISEPVQENVISEKKPIKKVLFIGDSMTGWMAERLNAYGLKNGFEVATIVWDGSTIRKWGSTSTLASRIKAQNPDAIFVSLGLNELFEQNPENRLGPSLNNILSAFGDIPFLWIGPPTWPGRKEGAAFNKWMENRLGESSYFRSDGLTLERQSKSNPHPSRGGIIKWIDTVVDWIPSHTNLSFEQLNDPGANEMSRGKIFIYKRMKENL